MTSQTYNLDGPKEFPFPHPVRSADQLTVEIVPGAAVAPGDYEVVGVGPTSTQVTVRYPNAPTSGGLQLKITRYVAPERVTQIDSPSDINVTNLNAEFNNVYEALTDFESYILDLVQTEVDAAIAAKDAAQLAAQEAEAAWDAFRDQYWGAYASDPSTSPLGNPPDEGDLYWNTTANQWRVWNGSAWQQPDTAVGVNYDRQDYVAEEGQTTFAATYDAGFVQVWVNGALLPPSDYEASSGTDVVLAEGVPADTEVTVIGLGATTIDVLDGDAAQVSTSTGTQLIPAALDSRVVHVPDIAALRALTGVQDGQRVTVTGYHPGSDIGGGEFYYDASRAKADHNGGTVISPTVPWDGSKSGLDGFLRGTGETDGAGAGCWVRRFNGPVFASYFGALGDNDQTLFSIIPYATDTNDLITISQQTADGVALCAALRFCLEGGYALQLLPGTFRTYGYLTRISAAISIRGAGIGLTRLVSCDASPASSNGYGIFVVDPDDYADVSISDMTLDGNVYERGEPDAEYRSYNIAVYGYPRFKMSRVRSINSPIDCFYTGYANSDPNTGVYVAACDFKDAYRNTISLVNGHNQTFVGCDVQGAGIPFGGTNPGWGLDVEPNGAGSVSIEGIRFISTKFSNCRSVLAGGVWCSVSFSECIFEQSGSALAAYPWLANFRSAHASFDGCRFNGDLSEKTGRVVLEYVEEAGDAFAFDQYTSFNACKFYGAGMQVIGRRLELTDTTFMESNYPLLVEQSATSTECGLFLRNVTMTNVFDRTNAGTGRYASFSIVSTTEGPVDIDGLTVRIDGESLAQGGEGIPSRAYGVYWQFSGIEKYALIKNVMCAGFYNDLPAAYGAAANSNWYRDWGVPSLPPYDSGGRRTGTGPYYQGCLAQGSGTEVESQGAILYGSATYDPASLSDGTSATTTVTVTGAALGDFATASFGADLQGVTLDAWVSAADTVSVKFSNNTGAAVDLPSATLRARVEKA